MTTDQTAWLINIVSMAPTPTLQDVEHKADILKDLSSSLQAQVNEANAEEGDKDE